MPPKKEALYLHINLQCQQWKKVLDHFHHFLDPAGHKWTDIDGSLVVQRGIFKTVPDSIIEFVSCSCKKSKCAQNYCGCSAVNWPCTVVVPIASAMTVWNKLTFMRSLMIFENYIQGVKSAKSVSFSNFFADVSTFFNNDEIFSKTYINRYDKYMC